MKKNVNNSKVNKIKNVNFTTPISLLNHFKKNENVDSIMNYDYYLSILNNVIDQFKSNRYEKAIDLLNEELDAPYIPTNVEKYFLTMIKLIRNQAYEKRNDKIQEFGASELINLALNNFPKNLHIFDYFTTKPEGFFEREDFDYFRFIFTSKDFSNDLKFNVLFLINEITDFSNIKLDFLNHNTNISSKIILGKEIINKTLKSYYDKVYEEISKLLFKDPSLEEMANTVVDQILSFYFPNLPPSNINSKLLGKSIANYVLNSFNNINEDKKTKNNEINDLILHAINAK
ncbi:DUF3196 family protein [Mycoplasmoides pirum]|uniref:DUF3196 family protein n=1 Tax=Mycoplasmoides pirum TaxID=2122 RepID=UPI000487C581|nr:DUF3196 family protein [Mycoplasmoides pirum]